MNTNDDRNIPAEVEALDDSIALNLNDNALPAGEVISSASPKKGRFDFSAADVSTTRAGTKVRDFISYEVVGIPSGNVKMQPQKALCLQLINDNTSDENPTISEPALKEIVEAAKASGVLETRQNAWRIFAYYKGQLVEEGYVKEHNTKKGVK